MKLNYNLFKASDKCTYEDTSAANGNLLAKQLYTQYLGVR